MIIKKSVAYQKWTWPTQTKFQYLMEKGATNPSEPEKVVFGVICNSVNTIGSMHLHSINIHWKLHDSYDVLCLFKSPKKSFLDYLFSQLTWEIDKHMIFIPLHHTTSGHVNCPCNMSFSFSLPNFYFYLFILHYVLLLFLHH